MRIAYGLALRRVGRGWRTRADVYNCHCSNCRATTGAAFLPWGEIEPEKLTVTKGAGLSFVDGDPDASHAVRCADCFSLLYWTGYEGARSECRMDH